MSARVFLCVTEGKEETMQSMFNPLQAVLESLTVFQDAIRKAQQEIDEAIRRDQSMLQMEACHLREEDPRLLDALVHNGPAARVFFEQYRLFAYWWSQFPLLRPWILSRLEEFVNKFDIVGNQVAAAAQIPPQQWEQERYGDDLAQVVSFHFVNHFNQEGRQRQQLSASDLVPQVVATHEWRCNQAQMQ